jgi:hypothetical protein
VPMTSRCPPILVRGERTGAGVPACVQGGKSASAQIMNQAKRKAGRGAIRQEGNHASMANKKDNKPQKPPDGNPQGSLRPPRYAKRPRACVPRARVRLVPRKHVFPGALQPRGSGAFLRRTPGACGAEWVSQGPSVASACSRHRRTLWLWAG